MAIEENAEILRDLRHDVCHVFMVEDLMYLKRGGRIDAASAIVGSVLSIKPILVIAPDGKVIGTYKTDPDGNVTISIEDLPAGLFFINSENLTFKVLKK